MKKDSEEAFIKMIEECSGIINSLCLVYHKNGSDIKDARQDIILQLWKSYSTFNNDALASTWVYRVSINTLLNRRRKHKKLDLVNIESVVEVGDTNLKVYSDDDVALLKELLNLLSDSDKSIMILYLEGYKYAEIADIISTTTTNVSTRINRIKRKLSAIFKKDIHEY